MFKEFREFSPLEMIEESKYSREKEGFRGITFWKQLKNRDFEWEKRDIRLLRRPRMGL